MEASPALTAASVPVQRWFAAHEVGHLRLGAMRPLRTALSGRAALACYEGAAVVLWVVTSACAPVLGIAGPWLIILVGAGWLACSQAEEYAADRLAARVLLAQGHDPLRATRAVMDQGWFGPRGRGVMVRVNTHPTVERRLAAVERASRQDAAGWPGR